jgi:hypothetical protein
VQQSWKHLGRYRRAHAQPGSDKDGNLLPRTATYGAYSLRAVNSRLQTALYEGKVVTDKTYGHATYGCMICCGYGGAALFADPTLALVDGTAPVGVTGNDNCQSLPTSIDDYYQTWSSSNTAVFTMSFDQLTGVSPGSAIMRAHASALPSGTGQDTPHSNTGVGSCPVLQNTALGTGNVAATKLPKYIVVNTDSTQVLACPNGTTRFRKVNYNVMATDGTQVTTTISLLETVDPATQSSCTNTTVGTSFQCTPIAAGNYTDGLSPGCPETAALNNGCGYTFPLQKWEWCNPVTAPIYPNLGTIGTDTVDNTLINLGGNTTQFAAGTTFPHD